MNFCIFLIFISCFFSMLHGHPNLSKIEKLQHKCQVNWTHQHTSLVDGNMHGAYNLTGLITLAIMCGSAIMIQPLERVQPIIDDVKHCNDDQNNIHHLRKSYLQQNPKK